VRSRAVIQRVRQLLAEGNAAAAQDGQAVADDYAALCRDANERLRACAGYLAKGMLSEALRIAETEPILLDLCGELDFVGVENWVKLCEEKSWTIPEAMEGKAIQALNEAYSEV